MLNASRHHGDDGLRVTSCGCGKRGGAQRLAASRRRRGRCPAPHRSRRGCAQRLAASRRRRAGVPGLPGAISDGCSTPRGITATTGCARAVDAVRPCPCSTPRGITATTGHGGAAARQLLVGVLNASRHHGDDGFSLATQTHPGFAGCSTPRGITATTGSSVTRSPTTQPRCSTPRGITATTGDAMGAWLNVRGQCSTPRGITATTGLPITRDKRVAITCSTPRGITATTGGTLEVCARTVWRVLNASRHHGDDGLSTGDRLTGRRYRCSTPRGITATTGKRARRRRGRDLRAQRLAASRRRRGVESP